MARAVPVSTGSVESALAPSRPITTHPNTPDMLRVTDSRQGATAGKAKASLRPTAPAFLAAIMMLGMTLWYTQTRGRRLQAPAARTQPKGLLYCCGREAGQAAPLRL